MKLILARHSLSIENINLPGDKRSLSELGTAQCYKLAVILKKYNPSVVVSNSGRKAASTAKLLSTELKIPFIQDNQLPILPRNNQGLSKVQDEANVKKFLENPDVNIFEKYTANQELEIFINELREIDSKYKNQTVIVVIYGTVITSFIIKILGQNYKPFDLWKKLDYPSYVICTWPPGIIIDSRFNID